MTVGELIEELKKFPQDLPFMIEWDFDRMPEYIPPIALPYFGIKQCFRTGSKGTIIPCLHNDAHLDELAKGQTLEIVVVLSKFGKSIEFPKQEIVPKCWLKDPETLDYDPTEYTRETLIEKKYEANKIQ